jgi:protein-L-isoaspartate(D-aspartate) O-methyltransferase
MSTRIFHLEPESPRDREHLVADLERSGIRDARVLVALRAVPRERFVPPEWAENSRGNSPLPAPRDIGRHASDPAIVALLAEALELTGAEKLLLIGAGYGYPVAILSGLAHEVIAIEHDAEIAAQARENLEKYGIRNVRVVVAEGAAGIPAEAPFDAIAVCTLGLGVAEAEGARVEWARQLRDGGKVAVLLETVPVGIRVEDQVAVFVKQNERLAGPTKLAIVRAR